MSDPRGLRRTIVAIEYGALPVHIGFGEAWLLLLDCEHVAYGNPSMMYSVGSEHHCLACKTVTR